MALEKHYNIVKYLYVKVEYINTHKYAVNNLLVSTPSTFKHQKYL